MSKPSSWRAVLGPLQWFRSAGVPLASEQGLEKQVSLTNDLTLIVAGLYCFGLGSDLFMPSSWMLGLDVFALSTHLSLPLMNHAGWLRLSRVLFVLVLNAVIFLATAAEGPGSGMQFLFPTFVGLPLVLFDTRERWSLGFSVMLPIACFVLLELGGYQKLLPDWMHLPTSRMIFWDSVASAFIFSFLTVLYFYVANRSALKLLQKHQARMIASSKLSALGEMASGVAHEINNPLGIITLLSTRLTQLVNAQPMEVAGLRKAALDIDTNTQRVAGIVRSLRAFARDGSQEPLGPVSVADVVNEALGFCRERFNHHRIELRVAPIPEDCLIHGRAVELIEILLNLFNNAYEAVERHGESNKWIGLDTHASAGKVEIHVTDSGQGVPPELREKVFEPFFTTKRIGSGTGLGLSVSLGLAQRQGGNLTLDQSSPVTRFVLQLPHFEPDATS